MTYAETHYTSLSNTITGQMYTRTPSGQNLKEQMRKDASGQHSAAGICAAHQQEVFSMGSGPLTHFYSYLLLNSEWMTYISDCFHSNAERECMCSMSPLTFGCGDMYILNTI